MKGETSSFPSVAKVSDSAWRRLSSKRIYFGHQSVGYSIIEGTKEVLRSNPQIKLRIVETSDPLTFSAPIFAHSRVGRNTDPVSKCDAFAATLENGIGNIADVVFFKFCYVDIMANSDPKQIFSYYHNTLVQLRRRYPRTRIFSWTAPLTRNEAGYRTIFKTLIGKDFIWEYEDNIKRHQFNEMLKTALAAEPVFDLASAESTRGNGDRETFKKAGQTYFAMAPEYTSDGGHLNELGQRKVAEQLLIFLAENAT
jgi:lysophospholipase L1-like esterase